MRMASYRLMKTYFQKCNVIPDINFTIENTDKQKEIFGNFMELLSSFGPEVHIQQVIYNKSIKPAELEKKVLMKSQNDKLNEYREEMNEMLIDKLSKVRNNIIHENILLFQLRQTISLLQKQVFQDLTMKYPKDLNV